MDHEPTDKPTPKPMGFWLKLVEGFAASACATYTPEQMPSWVDQVEQPPEPGPQKPTPRR